MKVAKLILKNSMRHKLRTFLTILGIALAIMAFGLIKTFITAFYAGARAASPDRLITRHAVAIVFTLPMAYKEQLLKVDGVEDVTYANWFGGIYIEPKNMFATICVDHENYFDIFPEFVIPPGQMEAFNNERMAVIAGQGLVDRFGWKVGDNISLIGNIYPGDWEFVLRGIYTGASVDTDETIFFTRHDYLDETMRQNSPGRAGEVGWYALKIGDPSRAAEISSAVDSRFDNSWAETRTETEKEFVLGFIELSSAIIVGLRIVSYLIIGVILMVLVNTMVMTSRERVSEYAFMKTLGFRGYHLVWIILGESMIIATFGAAVGLGLLILGADLASVALKSFFPGFAVEPMTFAACIITAFLVGLIASVFPIRRALKMKIVDGLRVVD